MLEYFRHQIIKTVITGFGTLFNNIYVGRYDSSGNEVNRVRVPVSYSPKQKFLVRLNQSDPNLIRQFEMTLPRISYELKNIKYSNDRKLITTRRILDTTESSNVDYRFNRVPYDIEYELNIISKNQDDAFQILEQILPYFTPDFTITFKTFPIEDQLDIPISLQNVTIQDNYEGDFEERKVSLITISFVARCHIYGPVKNRKLITKAEANLIDLDGYTVSGMTSTASGQIYDTYTVTGGTFAHISVQVTGGATAGSFGPTGTYQTVITEYGA